MFLKRKKIKVRKAGQLPAGLCLSSRGVLLIEALLTILVMTVCLAVIMGAQTSSLRARILTTEYTQAMWAAENRMFDLFVMGPSGGARHGDGVFDRRFEVVAVPDDTSGDTHLKTVSLEVRWKSGQNNRSLSFVTGLFVPRSGG